MSAEGWAITHFAIALILAASDGSSCGGGVETLRHGRLESLPGEESLSDSIRGLLSAERELTHMSSPGFAFVSSVSVAARAAVDADAAKYLCSLVHAGSELLGAGRFFLGLPPRPAPLSESESEAS